MQNKNCLNGESLCRVDIDIINIDESQRHQLLSDAPDPHSTSVSPDGKYFLYVSPWNGGRHIFLVEIESGNGFQLTHDTNMTIESPVWSPDSKNIVFSMEPVRSGNTTHRSGLSEIFVINVDGSILTKLTDNSSSDVAPKWSPDGRHIAFISDRDGNDELYLMNVDGSQQRRLTYDQSVAQLVDWSPKSQVILFTGYRSGKSTIFTLDITNGDQRALTNGMYDSYLPSWSPDGSKIVFTSRQAEHSQIFAINADGSEQKALSDAQTLDFREPSWSPNGEYVAFTTIKNGITELYVVQSDGVNLRRLPTGGIRFYLWFT
ncbi:MAG: PD40 domain-containing protein [Anaerolineae bacterium]|nr:PD40 domain-containing protein [Anaerolineae bacterium]